jgi:hypothetical protein
MDSETHTDEEFQPGLGATTPGSTSRAIQTFSTTNEARASSAFILVMVSSRARSTSL